MKHIDSEASWDLFRFVGTIGGFSHRMCIISAKAIVSKLTTPRRIRHEPGAAAKTPPGWGGADRFLSGNPSQAFTASIFARFNIGAVFVVKLLHLYCTREGKSEVEISQKPCGEFRS